ncbi:MurR/RpiR family transcriptional regulator [Guggenheimella bovis]
MKQQTVFETIKANYKSLSKTHKRIADFLTNHYDQAVFMTAKKLAERIQTSESTVVRFAFSLGYDGYPDLQENLRDNLKNILTSKQKLATKMEPESFEGNIKASFSTDLNNIRTTFENLNVEDLHKMAKAIREAKRVYILGRRSSKVLVDYLSFYLSFVRNDVICFHHETGDTFDQIVNLTDGDVVIVISFPRYSKQTLHYAEIIKKAGHTIFAITDNYDSPITHFSDASIYATYSLDTFIDSHVAPMALINALVTAIAYDNIEEVTKKFEALEQIWTEYNVYI